MEMILKLGVEYNLQYVDPNNNVIDKIVKIEQDVENENKPVIKEITAE